MTKNSAAHPGRLLKRELNARELSANRLALDIGVPSGRITDILNGRRSITADTAVRLGRYFGNSAQFWLDLQSQHDIAIVERERGAEIIRRGRPPDAAKKPSGGQRCHAPCPRHGLKKSAWASLRSAHPTLVCSPQGDGGSSSWPDLFRPSTSSLAAVKQRRGCPA